MRTVVRMRWARASKECDKNMASQAEKKAIEENYEKEKKKALPVFLFQFVFAIVFNVCVLGGGYYFVPCYLLPVPASAEFTVKLQYTLRCFGFPMALLLWFAIVRVARKRGNTPAGNPLSGQDKNYLLAEKNALTNTVEQILCNLLLVLVLITYLEPSDMRIVPLLSFSFTVGRLLFIFGYSVGPLYRVAGIIINFFSTMPLIVCIIYLMYRRGVMYSIPFTAPTGAGDAQSGKTEL